MEKIEITREEYEEYLRLKRKEENQRNLKNKKEQDNLHAKIIAMSVKGMEDKKIVQELDGDLSRASIYKTLRIETEADERRVRKLFDRKDLIYFMGIDDVELDAWLDERKIKVEDRKPNKNRTKGKIKTVEEMIEQNNYSHYRVRK